MTISRIEIDNFRHLRNLNFDLGRVITVIAGSNGTGKTSLLGIIGHVFKFGGQFTTLFEERYETKYSSVFRFSATHDMAGGYKYRVVFGDGTHKDAELRIATERGKIRHRIDVGGRVLAGGKIKLPVIFLSLKRLIPLAQENERTITFGGSPLSPALVAEYNMLYNQIFSTTAALTPTRTQSGNKNSVAPTTAQFDAYGISAGQDNIGSIILALLSFTQLKQQDPNYTGGLLLIDELDATLYPAAQKNLLKVLLQKGQALDLQIVFTTHSSDLLNFLSSPQASAFKNTTNFVGLSNALGSVVVVQGFSELKTLLADLNHDTLQAIRPKKLNFYFEDNEATCFYKGIVAGETLGCDIDYKPNSVSSGIYKTLITAGFEEFGRSVVVLDGDFRKALPESAHNTVVYLPGDFRPENIVKDFLEALPDNDPFWNNSFRYTKRVFLDRVNGVANDREAMKKWFKDELQFWGPEGATLFARWKALNQPIAQVIINRSRSVVKRILDNFYNLSTYS